MKVMMMEQVRNVYGGGVISLLGSFVVDVVLVVIVFG